MDLAAVADPQPLGKVGAGGAGPLHGHQLRPEPVKAALAIELSPCLGAASADLLDFCCASNVSFPLFIYLSFLSCRVYRDKTADVLVPRCVGAG